MHDAAYKDLFSHPRMVRDLLRGFAAKGWSDKLDFETLEKLPADYVSDDLRQRRGDSVWRVRFRGESWLYLLVMLEFQSTVDPFMAVRVLAYTGLLYQDLIRRRALDETGKLPPVLPVVLYNGDSEWSGATDVRELIAEPGPNLAPYQPSQRHVVLDERHVSADDSARAGGTRLQRLTRAVVLLEQSGSPEQLAHVAGLLKDWLGSSYGQELKRAFADWLWVLSRRLEQSREEPPVVPPKLTLEDVTMTLEERVISWREPWIRQGMEEGLRQGMEQGIHRERGLLRRLAEARFGADTAERLFGLLAREDDPQRLAAVGEAIVRCETSDDFLRRAFPNAPVHRD